MRASAFLTVAGGLMLLVAATAGCDLVFNGNEQALTGVIGASACAITLAVVGYIVRRFEDD